MKSAAGLFLGAAALMLLAGCDEFPNFHVINNTGQPIRIATDVGYPGAKRIDLTAGETSGRVFPPGEQPQFDVIAGGCAHHYRLPDMGVNFAWRDPHENKPDYDSHYPLWLQIEPDFAVFLLPPGATTLQAPAALRAAQAHGFPILPRARGCPPSSG